MRYPLWPKVGAPTSTACPDCHSPVVLVDGLLFCTGCPVGEMAEGISEHRYEQLVTYGPPQQRNRTKQ